MLKYLHLYYLQSLCCYSCWLRYWYLRWCYVASIVIDVLVLALVFEAVVVVVVRIDVGVGIGIGIGIGRCASTGCRVGIGVRVLCWYYLWWYCSLCLTSFAHKIQYQPYSLGFQVRFLRNS